MNPKFEKGLFKWIISLILLLGIGLRIVMFLQNRSLFIDEACLSSQLIERSFLGLFDNLEYQYAPPLFAILIKLTTLIFGQTEYALRLLPLLAAILSLPLFYKLCRHFLKPVHCIFPLILFTFGMPILQYATEVKQYSTDILVTILLVLLALKWSVKEFNKQIAFLWAMIGAIVVWFSMPGVFLLFGIGIYYFFESYTIKKWKDSQYIILPIIVWLSSFAIYYFTIIRNDIGLESLEDYHARFFIPLLPSTMEDWRTLGNILITFFRTAIGSTTLAIAFGIVTFIIGSWRLKKERVTLFLLFLLPIFACLLASGLKLYSLIPRLTLFLMPILLLILAIGTAYLLQKSHPYLQYLIYGVVLILMFNQQGYTYYFERFEIEELRPVLEYVRANREPEDSAYLYVQATHAYVFYSTYHEQAESLKIPRLKIGKLFEPPDNLELPNTQRCWLIFSHIEKEELQRYHDELSKRGTIEAQFLVKGGGALLFDREMVK